MGVVRQGSTWGLRAGVRCAIAVTVRHLKVRSTRVVVHCCKRGIASSLIFILFSVACSAGGTVAPSSICRHLR